MTQATWKKDSYTISTNPDHLDREAIYRYLSEESYWATGLPREVFEKSIDHSLCFGVFLGDPRDGSEELVGFARVISDFATFGYLADVFILEAHRGRGLSKWLVATILSHPELQGLRRMLLATRDAHTLYGKFGFKPLIQPEKMMEIARGKKVYQD